ncbi:MAG: hypothetical protein IJH81_09125 [Lachnospiraceae bacterium]|nr:hypothetical protein [Lachnospiraceae bacterium]
MNGLVVMDCVQTAYHGGYSGYGANGRLITIRGRKSSGRNLRSVTGNHTSFNNSISRNEIAGRQAAVRMNTAAESEKYVSKTYASEKSVSKKSVSKKSDSKKSVSKSVFSGKHVKAGLTTKDASGKTAATVRGRQSSGIKRSFFRALLLVFILTGTLAGFQMMTGASSRPQQQAWKYHTTVTIPCGEGLEDIVDQYCSSTYYKSREDYVREVCCINSLPYHRGEIPDLPSGTSLVIPYYSTEYK